MKQASHMMLCRDSLECLHDDVVVVYSQGCILIDDCQLMLCRSHLVVLGLCRDAKLPEFLVDISHERSNSLAEGSEVVIIQLLPLRRHRSEQGSACVDEILSLLECILVNQEILLFRSDRWRHFFRLVVSEESQQPERLCIDRVHRTKKRCLEIQRLSCIGAERSRDAENRTGSVIAHERRAGWIPCRISSGLEGCPKSA